MTFGGAGGTFAELARQDAWREDGAAADGGPE